MKIKYKTKPLELQVGDRVRIDGSNPLIDKYSGWSLRSAIGYEFTITSLINQYKGTVCIKTKLESPASGLGNTWNIPKELLIKCHENKV